MANTRAIGFVLGMVQLRVTAIPEVAIPWSSGFSRLTDRPADASLANGTKWAMAFSGWHARVLASMECRRGHAGRGYPADRVTPGLSMLTLRVSMAPVPVPVAGARRETIEQPKRASGRSFASVVTRKRPSLNRASFWRFPITVSFVSSFSLATGHWSPSPALTLPRTAGSRPPWCWQSSCRLALSRPIRRSRLRCSPGLGPRRCQRRPLG